MSDPFIAEIRIFGFNFAPRGWAFCNGQLLPIPQNTALFSLVGTMYGGDGRTTFGLPNLQGNSPMFWGRGNGLTERRIGEKGGFDTVTLATSQIPSHTHTVNAVNDSGLQSAPGGALSARANIYKTNPATNTLVNMSAQAISSTGGGQAHDNRQAYLAVNFCISLQGIFPQRS